ncbi:MAG: hypothetical protein COA60_003270 [Robiginitomaculum sp.]|nr:hypothetical protein [Robiginitomaculum sp.]
MNNTAFRANKTNIIVGGLILAIIIVLLVMRPGGIGGTGIGNGGVGGTGINTGFIGRIDQFGSIYVNDARIFYPANIKVQFNQRSASIDDLKIGQIVQVLASADHNGTLTASSIKVRFEVIGIVQSITENQAIVFGQKVILLANSVYPAIGDNIMVSGFRRNDGVIVASRIDPAEDSPASLLEPAKLPFSGQADNVSLSGYVQKNHAGYFIYGYQLENLDTDIPLDKVTTISAKVNANSLQVETLKRKITTLTRPKSTTPTIPVNEVVKPVVTPTNTTPGRAIEPKPIIRKAIDKPTNDRPNNIPDRAGISNEASKQEARPSEPVAGTQTEALPDATNRGHETDSAEEQVTEETIVERDANDNNADQEQSVRSVETEAIRQREATTPIESVTPERRQSPQRETRQPTTDRPPTRVRPERVDRPQRPERIERPTRPERPQRPDRRG